MERNLLWEVHIQNYKSMASCVVHLGEFTVLVGPNGAGKSNFIDGLRFVNECLLTSVPFALQNRGGINAVRRRSRGHPRNFGFRFRFTFGSDSWGEYSFEIAAQTEGRFIINKERCLMQPEVFKKPVQFDVERGTFIHEVPGIRPRIEPDRLALSIVSAAEEFRPIYDFLTGMRFYSLSPDSIRQLQEPDAGLVLKRDGSNAAAVLRELQRTNKSSYERLCNLLEKVVPGTSAVQYATAGQKETLTFKQNVGDEYPWEFDALNMSDGTLRALGILLSIYQVSSPSLIAIEEPEATIHPAALDVIVDIIKDGSVDSQVIITTHSPEILENRKIVDSEIRAVHSERGRTQIASLKETTKTLIKRHLYTGGELLRAGELEPDKEEAQEQERQMKLFGDARQVPSRLLKNS